MSAPANRLVSVEVDDSIGRGPSPEAEHERNTAIYDLIEDNRFALSNGMSGPYHLVLSTQEGRLVLDVRDEAQRPMMAFGLSLTPFRRIVKDCVDRLRPRTILDVFCGSGNLSLPLADGQRAIEGIEANAKAIAACRAKSLTRSR